jgi:hypothetical protein
MVHLKNVLLAMSCVQLHLTPVVISSRNIRIQNKVTTVKQSVQRPRSTQQTICKNECDGLRLRKPKKQFKAKDIPKKILSELSNAGAIVSKCPGEALYSIENIRFGDAAWNIFETFAESTPNRPVISVLSGPTQDVQNTSMPYPSNIIPAVVVEANSIRSHYAKLNVTAFAGGVVPAIPKPAWGPVLQVFNTTKVALSKLIERIQNPNHQEYPVLTALPPGSYICHVIYHWTNAAVLVAVFKPNQPPYVAE